jgi:hypothetical protein
MHACSTKPCLHVLATPLQSQSGLERVGRSASLHGVCHQGHILRTVWFDLLAPVHAWEACSAHHSRYREHCVGVRPTYCCCHTPFIL